MIQLAEAIDRGPRVAKLRTLGEAINADPKPDRLQTEASPPGAPSPGRADGLPGRLKAGVEALSGISMDRVKVHYNSSRPAQLNALAYAKGSDIHLGPGQESLLPHEAWHVVQQARGQVRPSLQLKGGVALNADSRLEREADAMGAEAARHDPSLGGETGARSRSLSGPWNSDGTDCVVQAVGNRLFNAFSSASERSLEGHQSADLAARSLIANAEGEEEQSGVDFDSDDDFSSDRYLRRDDELGSGAHATGRPVGSDDDIEEDDESKGVGNVASVSVRGASESGPQEQPDLGMDYEYSIVDDEGHEPVGAYIVNAILPYGEVDRIVDVVKAMLTGLGKSHEARVAVVLGINAPDNQIDALTTAFQKAMKLIDTLPVAIGLVPSTFKAGKSFPYGTMRNAVLHSPETLAMTEWFTGMGLHPYISFQDFDTGSRRVGSEEGPHVFDAMDEILSGRPAHALDHDPVDPIRPLMVAGGYRPGSLDVLFESTWKRVEQQPIKGMTREKVREGLAGFEASIAKDMKARDHYAALDPLLPYAPEPNLFIDATAAAIPSPISGSKLEFGPDGAEFTALGKRLAQYAAEELEAFHAKRLPPGNVDRYRLAQVQGDLMVDAQNNRHPLRVRTFHTDFQDLSVATDLSRLAYGALQGQKPQNHTGLAQVMNRFFDTKKDKDGASFTRILDDFKEQEDRLGFMEQLYRREGGEPTPQSTRYFNSRRKDLGGLKRQKMSGALHQPFSNSGFLGLEFGTDPQLAMYFAQQVALRSEAEENRSQALKNSVQTEAQRIGVTDQYTVGHADGGDRNCAIISIFAAANRPIGRQEALGYRRRLAARFPIGLSEDIHLTPEIADGILHLVTEATGNNHRLWTLAEGPPGENGRPSVASVPLAGAGPAIYIFFAGNHFSPAWPVAPLGGERH